MILYIIYLATYLAIDIYHPNETCILALILLSTDLLMHEHIYLCMYFLIYVVSVNNICITCIIFVLNTPAFSLTHNR